MIIPIRCFSCGKPVAHLWEDYKKRVAKGEDPKKVMDSLEIKRFCCRSVFLGQTDMYKEIAQFKK